MGLLAVIFCKFVTELWPLIDVRILFPLNISGEQMDRILTNFVYAFILTISKLGLLPVIFFVFVTELWPLIDVRILFLLKSLYFPAQYL